MVIAYEMLAEQNKAISRSDYVQVFFNLKLTCLIHSGLLTRKIFFSGADVNARIGYAVFFFIFSEFL